MVPNNYGGAAPGAMPMQQPAPGGSPPPTLSPGVLAALMQRLQGVGAGTQPPQQPMPGAAPPAPGAPPMQGGGPMAMGPGGGGGGGIDPNTVNAVLQLNAQGPQQAQVQQQLRMADQMRQDGQQQLRGTQAGRIYKAPGVLNGIAGLADNVIGGQMQTGAQNRMGALGQQQADAMKQYYQGLSQANTRLGLKPPTPAIDTDLAAG